MYYIGIDLGTSAVKLLLLDANGTVKKTTSREYPLFFPQPGWSEQDPRDWFAQTMDGLGELLEGCDRTRVAGISFGGQMHGLVALDKNGEVIRPAILWNDSRAAEQSDYLNRVVGRQTLTAHTANISFAGFTAPKLLWMRDNEPEKYAGIAKLLLPKDYLCYRLTGRYTTDVSDASRPLLFDVKNRCWSQELCAAFGVETEWLPQVYESYEAVGTLLPEIAKELGLGKNVKVAAGAGDNAAAAVGTGTVGDGACNLSLGTSGTLFVASETFGVDKSNALHSFAHADGHWHLMGCILSAASCNRWWMDEIIGTRDYGREQAVVGELGANHVYFLPYLMGERSPHNDPLARGTFTGITMDTTRADMTQAVLEGVAFALKDCLVAAESTGVSVARSKLCGGGAKSALWKRILANVLDVALEVPQQDEGPAMGAAMLAAVACGEFSDVGQAAQALVRVAERIEPEEALVQRYRGRYEMFRELYPALAPVLNKYKGGAIL